MEHNYSKAVAATKLSSELEESSISAKIISWHSVGEDITIETDDLTSGDQTILDAIVNGHDAQTVDMEKYIQGKIEAAMDFGKHLMSQYGARNVLAGRTVVEVRAISDKLNSLQTLLLSGSLHVALAELAATTPDTLITQDDLDEFTGKINTYLGI